jgi:hypothetical protein
VFRIGIRGRPWTWTTRFVRRAKRLAAARGTTLARIVEQALAAAPSPPGG